METIMKLLINDLGWLISFFIYAEHKFADLSHKNKSWQPYQWLLKTKNKKKQQKIIQNIFASIYWEIWMNYIE